MNLLVHRTCTPRGVQKFLVLRDEPGPISARILSRFDDEASASAYATANTHKPQPTLELKSYNSRERNRAAARWVAAYSHALFEQLDVWLISTHASVWSRKGTQ